MYKVITFSNSTISILYDVIGTLSSPIEQGEMGAKRFTLQAVDGPLNCLFWEIVCYPLHCLHPLQWNCFKTWTLRFHEVALIQCLS